MSTLFLTFKNSVTEQKYQNKNSLIFDVSEIFLFKSSSSTETLLQTKLFLIGRIEKRIDLSVLFSFEVKSCYSRKSIVLNSIHTLKSCRYNLNIQNVCN